MSNDKASPTAHENSGIIKISTEVFFLNTNFISKATEIHTKKMVSGSPTLSELFVIKCPVLLTDIEKKAATSPTAARHIVFNASSFNAKAIPTPIPAPVNTCRTSESPPLTLFEPITSTIKLQKALSQIPNMEPIVAKMVPMIKVANKPFAIPPNVTVKKFLTFFPINSIVSIIPKL